MATKEDREIVQKIQAGDKQAEKELFDHFGPKIVSKVCASIGSNNDYWKDVVGDIQMAILVSLRNGKYNPDKGVPLGSYIYGIVLNKLKDFFKRSKKENSISYGKLPESIFSAAEDYELELREMRTELRRLLSTLKFKYKEVLYLRYFEQLSISEISDHLNLPKRRVSERINYALKLMKKKCKNIDFFSIFWLLMLIII